MLGHIHISENGGYTMKLISKGAAAAAGLLAVLPAHAADLDPTANGFTMICAVLVILMTLPGIALFYGGLVRTKNVLSILVQSLAVFSLMYVLWGIYGYSLAFTGPIEDGSAWHTLFFGDFSKFFLSGITPDTVLDSGLSELTYFCFQGAFAAITAGLILGSFAGRIKFSGFLIMVTIWFTFAYVPSWHMVWGGGWLDNAFHVWDFAGGTVVHIDAAVCALVGAYYVKARIGYGKERMAPHSLPLCMIGAALLWVGWFGFNAGSELTPDGTAALAFMTTCIAPACAVIAWSAGEWVMNGKPSCLGACSGAVAGLVAITPACGFVGFGGAIVIGLAAGFICLWGVHGLKKLLKVDDSLDVFGVHGVGGIVGALLTGIFCAPELGGTGFKEGNDSIISQFTAQLISVVVTIGWTGIVSLVGYWVADKLVGIRVSADEEREGLDLASHGERGYNY